MIEKLDDVIEKRKTADPLTSYTAQLFSKGLSKINKKVIEESCEVIEAAHEKDINHLVYEVADLWFHTLVLLHYKGLSGTDVLKELEKRFGTSGIEEKNSRMKD